MLEWLRERAESDLEIKKHEIKEKREERAAMETTRLEQQQQQQQQQILQVLQQQQAVSATAAAAATTAICLNATANDGYVSTTTRTNAGSAVFSTKKGIILMYIQS